MSPRVNYRKMFCRSEQTKTPQIMAHSEPFAGAACQHTLGLANAIFRRRASNTEQSKAAPIQALGEFDAICYWFATTGHQRQTAKHKMEPSFHFREPAFHF
jgi:hypothetical protein